MPQTPPPYVDITGISRTVMKDNAQETLVNYDGNARPGEIVADLTTDPPVLYVGNNAGQLTALSSGGAGTYGNANVAAYLPTYTGNLVSLTGAVTTTANITANFFIGNGSQLTGIVSSYGDSNVAAYLPTYTGNLVSLTGDVTTIANVTAGYVIGTIAVRTTATTASGLPVAANAGAGARGFVTDADANTFNAPLVGGGANAVPVFSNGTGWFIG
jgi:hypothetical protein